MLIFKHFSLSPRNFLENYYRFLTSLFLRQLCIISESRPKTNIIIGNKINISYYSLIIVAKFQIMNFEFQILYEKSNGFSAAAAEKSAAIPRK